MPCPEKRSGRVRTVFDPIVEANFVFSERNSALKVEWEGLQDPAAGNTAFRVDIEIRSSIPKLAVVWQGLAMDFAWQNRGQALVEPGTRSGFEVRGIRRMPDAAFSNR